MLYFLILVILIVFALGHRDSKPIFYILYSLLFIISVGTYGGYDIGYLENAYNNPWAADNSEDKSYVFDSYMLFLKSLGFSFSRFRIFNFLSWSIPIVLIIRKLCKDSAYVLALCFFFPLLSFSSQMRNGLAMSFIFWGVYFYLKKRNSIIGKISYMISLPLAFAVHSMTLAYVAGIVAFSRKISTSALFRVCSIIAVVFAFFISTGFLYFLALSILGEYYANTYFAEVEPFVLGNSHLFLGIIINIWFLFQAENVERKNINKDDSIKYELTYFILRLNIVLLAISPLMLLSLSFYRIFQNIFFFSVICVANASNHRSPKTRALSNIYVLFYFIVTLLYIAGQGEFLLGWDNIRL